MASEEWLVAIKKRSRSWGMTATWTSTSAIGKGFGGASSGVAGIAFVARESRDLAAGEVVLFGSQHADRDRLVAIVANTFSSSPVTTRNSRTTGVTHTLYHSALLPG